MTNFCFAAMSFVLLTQLWCPGYKGQGLCQTHPTSLLVFACRNQQLQVQLKLP